MGNQFNISDFVANEAERLVVAFRQKLVSHSGEFGRAREEIVREFLRQQLPKRFAVSTGFVIDVHGSVSQQADIVVYDAQECPVFASAGGVSFFPCEGVVCAGQVKSRINSKQEYHAALANLQSIKSLDRSASGSNVTLRTGDPIEQHKDHLDQIFTFVFVIEHCLKERALMLALLEHLGNNERFLWPNITYVFDKYFATLGCHGGICPNPMDAFGMSVVKDVPNSELLLWFCRLVTQAVVATNVATFSYHSYMQGNKPRPWRCHTFRDAPVTGPLPDHLTEIPVPDWWQPNAKVPDDAWPEE